MACGLLRRKGREKGSSPKKEPLKQDVDARLTSQNGAVSLVFP